MKNKDFRALMAYSNAARLSRVHRNTLPSKRTAKGAAKHVGVALKHSRIYSMPMDKLYSSTRNYKALNPDSRLVNQAS